MTNINAPVPRPDGGTWPHLYDAVSQTLRDGGFYVGALGLVHVATGQAPNGGRAVGVSMEPSSDEEIERLLTCLADGWLVPERDREQAAVDLRRGLVVPIIPTPKRVETNP